MLLGVDVGGTFTDAALLDGDRLHTAKVPSTPEDQSRGVIAAVDEVLGRAGAGASDIDGFTHGMTVGTNALLEERGARTALVATRGFADLIDIGRQSRPSLYHPCRRRPRALVDPEDRFEAAERTGAYEVIVELTDEEVERLVDELRDSEAESIAVCLLFAFRDPSHEERIATALRDALPDLHVSASHEVLPAFREYERFSTTVIDAYLSPLLGRSLTSLTDACRDRGLPEPEVMRSSGGTAEASEAARAGAWSVLSGPAGGAVGAALLTRASGHGDAIGIDMGGTSCDVCVVDDGAVRRTDSREIEGRPIQLPMVDVHTVGAGGGSIAWRDAGGALRVGPRSAGAVPGPACYGRGGTDPTVTDANLLLGYLNPVALAGGVTLSVELSEAAIDKVAGPLGLDRPETARAIHEVVNANMAAAIRVVTVQRGIDPRGFTLVGFGGAGPMHVARLAETFNITSVAVPFGAGVASAIGLMTSDLSVDEVRTRLMDEAEMDASIVNTIYDELVDVGRSKLPPGDDSALVVVRSADVRYRGQAHQLTIPVPGGVLSGDDLTTLAKTFGEHYRQTYGIEADVPVQLLNYRVRVVRVVDKYQPAPSPEAPEAGGVTERKVYFSELGGYIDTPVHQWLDLRPGNHVQGPAIVEGPDTTVVVPPAFEATVDQWRSVLLSSRATDRPR